MLKIVHKLGERGAIDVASKDQNIQINIKKVNRNYKEEKRP